jgi:hypothetical protein
MAAAFVAAIFASWVPTWFNFPGALNYWTVGRKTVQSDRYVQ